MTTKPTKKKGETSTTVSVGIRIDPKIKFSLEMMARLQKRSLTAVVEWAVSKAMADQPCDFDLSFTQAIDKVWSSDESMRFANIAFHMPNTFSYDELRVWETIQASSVFWHTDAGGACVHEGFLLRDALRDNWTDVLEHVQNNQASPTIVPFTPLVE